MRVALYCLALATVCLLQLLSPTEWGAAIWWGAVVALAAFELYMAMAKREDRASVRVDFEDETGDISVVWNEGRLDWVFGAPLPSIRGTGVEIKDRDDFSKDIAIKSNGVVILEMPYEYREDVRREGKEPKRDRSKRSSERRLRGAK